MSGVKKERWTEADVMALPAGEHDYFDRKSGALLISPTFREDLAKALSAFSNSGGGHLMLGVRDDGTFDGVPSPFRGRTPTREWLEQIVPNLLSYPLEDFRVHEVEPSSPSAIPAGLVAIVIDVGDSALAPHQASRQRTYYYREAGHSKPAPHFYLEAIRNRLVRPMLEPDLTGILVNQVHEHEGGLFAEMQLAFAVKNTGRVAAYKWALMVERMSGHAPGREEDYCFSFRSFPRGGRGRDSSISLDDTILPSLSRTVMRDMGVHLRPSSLSADDLNTEVQTVLGREFTLHFRVVSETSPGELHSRTLVDLPEYTALPDAILAAYQDSKEADDGGA